jgi:hypothetical protein
MKSLIQVLLEISQDKMYLRTFVLKLTDQSLPYVLMSSKLAVRILALPEGMDIHIFVYIYIHIYIYYDAYIYICIYVLRYIYDIDVDIYIHL